LTAPQRWSGVKRDARTHTHTYKHSILLKEKRGSAPGDGQDGNEIEYRAKRVSRCRVRDHDEATRERIEKD